MGNNRGRRFDTEPKLNVKKVVATIIALLVLIMVIVSIVMLFNRKQETQVQNIETEYFALYTNEKWGVTNSNGDAVIPATYDEIVIVPDSKRPLFICQEGQGENYTTKVINEKNEAILTNYNKVEPIINKTSSDDVWFEENVLTFEKDGKYGLIDFDGNQILPAEYEKISSLKGVSKSIIIEKDGKKGLLNNISKEIIINPEYTEIKALGLTYDSGYIVKNSENKYGIIGSDKNVILENKYDDILNVHGNDMYVVKENDKYSVIDKTGIVILDSGFDSIISINGDNIIIKKDNKYGIVNTKKETIIETKYDDLSYCFGDNYIAKKDNKYGVINTSEETKIEFKYNSISYRNSAGFLECENDDLSTDIYNSNFEFVITGTVNKVDTEKGYIRIRVNDEYKYYNLQFEEKSNRDVLTNNTLFLVKKDGKYGYVDKDGNQVVDCKYDDAMEQNKFGFCAVNKDGKWGALKSDGTVILEPSVDLSNNINVDFIGTLHMDSNLELNAYTK